MNGKEEHPLEASRPWFFNQYPEGTDITPLESEDGLRRWQVRHSSSSQHSVFSGEWIVDETGYGYRVKKEGEDVHHSQEEGDDISNYDDIVDDFIKRGLGWDPEEVLYLSNKSWLDDFISWGCGEEEEMAKIKKNILDNFGVDVDAIDEGYIILNVLSAIRKKSGEITHSEQIKVD